MNPTGAALIVVAIAATLAACGTTPAQPQLTQTQREDQFWTAFQARTGLTGTDYADPAKARSSSITYGYFLCDKLAKGTDRDVLISQGSTGSYTREEFTAQLDTAVEYLCPDQKR